MMNIFIYLQQKRMFRSSFWQKNLALNIVIGILLILVLTEVLAIGLFLEQILSKSGNGVSPEILLNRGIIYYFLVIFMLRFFIQDLPTMEVSPLLHLPIKKSRISLFLNYRSLLSFFNFLPFLLFLPFTIHYLPAHYPLFSALNWFLAVFFIELSSNFLLIRIKRKTTVTPSVIFILIGIAAVFVLLEKYNLFSLSVITSWYFRQVLQQPLWIILPVGTAGLFFWENFRYTSKHLFLEDLAKKSKKAENLSRRFSGLENRGKIGTLILGEVKLLLRNKRSKQMLTFALPIFLLYGLFFYPDPENLNKEYLLYLLGIFITGGFFISYGQYILAWESSHFDFILTSNINTEEFFRAKYYLMTIPTLILFFLTIPYVYFGTRILFINFIFLIYNMGINAPLLLFMASFNRKRMELDRGQMMNYQGVGINNFLNIIPLLVIPILLTLFLNTFFSQTASLWIIFTLGVTGIIFHRQLINLAASFFKKNRYKIANGYRNT